EKLADNALQVGAYMMDRFREMQKKYPEIGDVRGRGLVMGLEFVEDRESRTPDADMTLQVMLSAARHGLLLGRVGLHGNVVRIAPPLVVSEAEAGAGLDIIDRVLSEL
ncbi:MAG: aminotransferase class III-fold pyridoxal phosphate-dependent enzyme, partial [Gemmatimonadetes bacterium]|nr:aminotransferase class III-fold pyridoxal phosphate-dependent enzyme [Gemmatimonadota bacterium]